MPGWNSKTRGEAEAKTPSLPGEQPETEPISVSMSQVLYGLEARIRYLETQAYRNVSDDIIGQWDEVDEQGTRQVTIRNKEVFRAIVPSGDTVLEDEQRMNRGVIDKIKLERGSAEKTTENRIAKRLEEIHAEEQRMREEETDFEQREIDERNAKKTLADKQVAERLAYIQSHPPAP